MNGMDPPMPACTGARPQPAVMAAVASAMAQPVVSTRKGSPWSTSLSSTCAPKGRFRSTCASRARYASAAVWPGAMRALMRTDTSGRSVLLALATEGASMPVTVMAGCAQRRVRMGPVPTAETPGSSAASSARRASS